MNDEYIFDISEIIIISHNFKVGDFIRKKGSGGSAYKVKIEKITTYFSMSEGEKSNMCDTYHDEIKNDFWVLCGDSSAFPADLAELAED